MDPGQVGLIHAAEACDVPFLLQQAVGGVPFKMRLVVLEEDVHEVVHHLGSPRRVLAPPHHAGTVRRQFEALKRVDGPALLVVFGGCVTVCSDILREATYHYRHIRLTVLIVVIGDACPLKPDVRYNVGVFYVSQAETTTFVHSVWKAYFGEEPLSLVRRRLASAYPQRIQHDFNGGFLWYHLTGGAEGLFESSAPHTVEADGGCWVYFPTLQKILLGVSPQVLTAAADDDCAVCLEDLAPGTTVWRCCRCNHCVHAQCGLRWLGVRATCVLCRAAWSLVCMKNAR